MWAALGARIGKKRGYLVVVAGAGHRRGAGRARPVGAGRGAVRRDGPGRRRATPAARCSRWRCCRTPRRSTPARTGSNRAGVYTGVWTAGETLGLALGPGRLRAGAGARRLPVVDRPATSPSPTPRSPRSCSASRCCRPLLTLVSLLVAVPLLTRRRGGGPHDRRRPRPAPRACRPATCRCTAAGRWPTSTTPACPTIDRIGREAVAAYAGSNGLDPTAFPSLLTMENDLVGFACDLLDAPADRGRHASPPAAPSRCCSRCRARATAGPTSSGRRWWCRRPCTRRSARPPTTSASSRWWCRSVPTSGPTPRRWPPRSTSGRCSWSRRHRRTRTAWSTRCRRSRPRPPRAGVRCHVDACIGGWVLPYAARLGRAVPPWTFAVDGVTSISVDTHKYAYAPKGTSLLLHRTLGRCGGRSSSRRPTGRATRCSTRRCSRRSPAGRWPAPGRWCSRWATRATCG